jgi:hypothetical protein
MVHTRVMKRERLFIVIPIIIIIALLSVIGFQLAKSQFKPETSTTTDNAPRSTGDGGKQEGGRIIGPGPGGGKITPPSGQ